MKRWYAVPTLAALAFAAACSDTNTGPMALAPDGLNAAISAPVDAGAKVCPNTGVNGWTKIDSGSGSSSGAWGSLSYPKGPTITVNVNAGYTVEICVKSGSQVNDGEALIYTVTGPEVNGTITIAQDISHTGWRVVSDPPVNQLQNLGVSKDATASHERFIEWTLTKTVNGQSSVSFTGSPGNEFTANWEVVATKTTDLLRNYLITGNITVNNPNPVAVGITVGDALRFGGNPLAVTVEIDCGSGYASSPVAATVPAKAGANDGQVVCAYRTVGLTNSDVDANRADVAVTSYTPPADYTGTIQGGFASTSVTWGAPTLNGDPNPLLADARPIFDYSENISATTTVTRSEIFACPAYSSIQYPNDTHSANATNTATLTGTGLSLSASAAVSLNCAVQWAGETATGAGYPWSATKNAASNWFMYTPWNPVAFAKFAMLPGATIALDPTKIGTTFNNATVQVVPLIAGQQHLAGTITGARNGTTSLTIALNPGFRFANVSNSVKIHPMSSCATSQSYVQPGGFSVKKTPTAAEKAAGAITVPGMANRDCYAIHVDVQRMLP